jgi:cytochrome c oxidase cbb3-type subunit 1
VELDKSVGNEKFLYHDDVVKHLVLFSVFCAIAAMAVGVYIAAELVWPTIDFGQYWLSFGRLRPLHTNGIIFGFAVPP